MAEMESIKREGTTFFGRESKSVCAPLPTNRNDLPATSIDPFSHIATLDVRLGFGLKTDVVAERVGYESITYSCIQHTIAAAIQPLIHLRPLSLRLFIH